MKITRGQLRRLIVETAGEMRSREAAQHAIKIVGYPQGGLIENEIHNYLESQYGMDPHSEEIFAVADRALSIAGQLLGVGDTL
jgi:hypothetical protein